MQIKIKNIAAVVMLLVLAIPGPKATAQYLNKLYDFDSSAEGGTNVFIQSDGNYFVAGVRINQYNGWNDLCWMNIPSNGAAIYNKHNYALNYADCSPITTGRIKQFNGGSLMSFTVSHRNIRAKFYATVNIAGLAKLNASYDTVFIKTYTDTNQWYDVVADCEVMPDGSYWICGNRTDTVTISMRPSYALLMHIDTNGKLLWTKQFQKYSGESAAIKSVQTLPDGRVLVGAAAIDYIFLSAPPHFSYFRCKPWYIIMDTAGNILKDTVWNSGYNGEDQGCSIFKDINGGYYTWAAYDSMLQANPINYENFPNFIAHLDTNFRIEWIKEFPFLIPVGHKEIYKVIQLHDGGYLTIGSNEDTTANGLKGWVAKINKTGNLVWEHEYIADTNYDAIFFDAKEKPDHNIILVGEARSGALPSWRGYDVWLVGIDSNGCEMPGCTLSVPIAPQPPEGGVKVWLNPITNSFSIKADEAGIFYLNNIQGQEIARYTIEKGSNQFSFPNKVAAGVYIGRYISDKNNMVQVIRLVYQP